MSPLPAALRDETVHILAIAFALKPQNGYVPAPASTQRGVGLTAEVEAYGPVFRHLFGVSEEEVWSWPEDRRLRHKDYADAFLSRQQAGGV
jgi:hypothetical protein